MSEDRYPHYGPRPVCLAHRRDLPRLRRSTNLGSGDTEIAIGEEQRSPSVDRCVWSYALRVDATLLVGVLFPKKSGLFQ